jgi:hypothetical protein
MNPPQTPGRPPEAFPPGLDGGEAPGTARHRIGERERQDPKVEDVDPAPNPETPAAPDPDEGETGL